MKTFKNPSNGYTESVNIWSSVGVLCFGLIYLLIRGLWAHVLIWAILVIVPAALSGGVLLVFSMPIVSIGYAIAMPHILQGMYLRKGWIEV